jgi:Tfp pilus assembly protein PilN
MTRINLLPPEHRAKASREQGILLVVLGLVAVVLVLGAVYFLTLQKVNGKQEDVDVAQVQIDQVNQQIEELRPYEAIETQKVSMAETVKGLYDSRVLWSAILEEISLVIPDTVDLTQMSCTVPSNMLAGSVDASGATEAVGISFSGQAGTFRDVGEFMTRLGLLPQIMNPRLLSATASTPTAGQEAFVTFQVEVSLRPFQVPPPVLGVPVAPAPAATTEGTEP